MEEKIAKEVTGILMNNTFMSKTQFISYFKRNFTWDRIKVLYNNFVILHNKMAVAGIKNPQIYKLWSDFYTKNFNFDKQTSLLLYQTFTAEDYDKEVTKAYFGFGQEYEFIKNHKKLTASMNKALKEIKTSQVQMYLQEHFNTLKREIDKNRIDQKEVRIRGDLKAIVHSRLDERWNLMRYVTITYTWHHQHNNRKHLHTDKPNLHPAKKLVQLAYGKESLSDIENTTYGQIADSYLTHLGLTHYSILSNYLLRKEITSLPSSSQDDFGSNADLLKLLYGGKNNQAWYKGGDLVLSIGGQVFDIQLKSSINSNIAVDLTTKELNKALQEVRKVLYDSSNNKEQIAEVLFDKFSSKGVVVDTKKNVEKFLKDLDIGDKALKKFDKSKKI